MLKFLITAASSNSGKTAVTCGLLSLLRRRGYDPCAFKCGPDYIDPMFHRSVMGIRSDNLDVFLAGEDGVRAVFARGCQDHDAAVCEGVMGYYDGMTERAAGPAAGADSALAGSAAGMDSGLTGPAAGAESPERGEKSGRGSSAYAGTRASAWHVASLLEIPAILVLRPKGAALTLAAVIKGMASFRSLSRIRGVIFNDCSEMYYQMYAPVIEEESGIPVLGYLPHMEEAVFESRHLGLMTAEEIRDLSQRIERIGARMEETIDLQRLVEATGEAAPGSGGPKVMAPGPGGPKVMTAGPGGPKGTIPESGGPVRIAVAKDAAFNFIYAQTITALEEAGARIVYFSPLEDQALPEDIDGLYLPGGYPELYGKQLSENVSMRESIRSAVTGEDPLPTVAECGGFLYLGETLEDADGHSWPMVGALPGHGGGTGKLVRFGYGHIESEADSMLFRKGERIPVHEFHYWDTTAQGSDLKLTKNSNGKQWRFGYAGETIYAGFPHLYLGGDPDAGRPNSGDPKAGYPDGGRSDAGNAETLASRFVEAARSKREKKTKVKLTSGAGKKKIRVDRSEREF